MACYCVLRYNIENGAKGCEVIVSGKLRAQRAKSMKFKDGYMISFGQPEKEYIDSDVRHVLLRQLIPFGIGKRIYSGISFTIAGIELSLAYLLYHFDWKLPGGVSAQEFDMTENFGVLE
ncbi:40S ribosomal protein S3 [Forsythia ovata]|uniref:40S ribosomal protein S3 n=1 Tax=Forsythia ovata TaxID=205694 RepID=A0ABD1W6Y9_9LAMI